MIESGHVITERGAHLGTLTAKSHLQRNMELRRKFDNQDDSSNDSVVESPLGSPLLQKRHKTRQIKQHLTEGYRRTLQNLDLLDINSENYRFGVDLQKKPKKLKKVGAGIFPYSMASHLDNEEDPRNIHAINFGKQPDSIVSQDPYTFIEG